METARGLHNLLARRRKAGFPMIGKYFSNGWKNGRNFPMIGKTFREAAKNAKRAKETRVAGGERKEIYKNGKKTASRTGRSLDGVCLLECLGCRFAALECLEKREGCLH